jgi:hypothetical protein
LKQELNDMAPAKAGNNIGEMLLMMQSLIQQIELKGGTHQDLVLNIFNSCEKSSNATFVNFTRTLRDEWESSLDDETDSEETIIDKLATRWNNIYARDPKKTASDPPDAKFTAMTTEISSLKELIKAMQSSSGGGHDDKKNFIVDWRHKKSFGETVDKDGMTWHWCIKHMDGKGLYVTRKEEDHAEWEEIRDFVEDKGQNPILAQHQIERMHRPLHHLVLVCHCRKDPRQLCLLVVSQQLKLKR